MSQAAVNLLIEHMESNEYQSHGRTFIDGHVVGKQSIAPPKVTHLI
jgi:hypothetical protein